MRSSIIVLCYIVCVVRSFQVFKAKTAHELLKITWSTPKRSISTENPIRLPESSRKYYWNLSKVAFSLLPLYPGARRKTLQAEVVQGKIWTLDQLQGIISVNVPVRSVIVKLNRGGLLVYNPVAPTQECIEYVRDLERLHGKVQHIVLGTLGLEHKAFVGPFSQYFPLASVWAQKGQWSFPLNLPDTFLGFPSADRFFTIPESARDAPWYEDFDHAVLGPLKFKSVGAFGETAMFHRETRTLLVTDTIVKIGERPSPILEEDPRALLFHSRDKMLDDVKDTDDARLRGWRRIVLFALTFFPAGIKVENFLSTFLQQPRVSESAKIVGAGLVPGGTIYPWSWVKSETPNFKALQGGLLVAPILKELILNREPSVVRQWVDRISAWPIRRIVPSHLENNIAASGKDIRAAFDFVYPKKQISSITRSSNRWLRPDNRADVTSSSDGRAAYVKEEDLKLLKLLSDIFTKLGVVAPPAPV